MYPTPDLNTVLAEHRSRIEQAEQRRLVRAIANERKAHHDRRGPGLLSRLRAHRPASAAATPAVAAS